MVDGGDSRLRWGEERKEGKDFFVCFGVFWVYILKTLEYF